MLKRFFALACFCLLVQDILGNVPVLVNGSFSDGEKIPVGWSVRSEGKPVVVSRDLQSYASAPAALRIETVGDSGKGMALQKLDVKGGEEFCVQGVSKGTGKFGYCVVALFAPGVESSWQVISHIRVSDGWSRFGGVANVSSSNEVFLAIMISGHGCLLVDDLSVVSVDDWERPRVVADFNEKPSFAYGTFKDNVGSKDGVLRIDASSGEGGVGVMVSSDFSGWEERSPSIRVKLGKKNQAKFLKLKFFNDKNESSRIFSFYLNRANDSGFTDLLPAGFIGMVDEVSGSFDMSRITQVHVKGDWRKNALDVYVDKIELVELSDELLAKRAAVIDRALRLQSREQKPEKNIE